MKASKAMDDVLTDQAFWQEQRDIILAAVEPMMLEAFLVGAALAAENIKRTKARRRKWWQRVLRRKEDGEAFPWDELDTVAERFVAEYSSAWWDALEPRIKDELRSAILAAQTEGIAVADVAARLEPIFGKTRAMRIAQTEITNVMGQGATAEYQASGFGQWGWRTVEDKRVCPQCNALNGVIFPIATSFMAAHVGCRCWPVPEGDAGTLLPSAA